MAKSKYDPNEVVTRKMLDEAVDVVLKGIEGMFQEVIRDLRELKLGQRHHKDQIDGLKADLSTTATKKDVDYLQEQIDVLDSNTP